MTIATETLAEIALDGKISYLGPNDAARSSFSTVAGGSLVALSPQLEVLGQWPVDPGHFGFHATCPSRGLALISGPAEVSLLDHTGRARWRYSHPAWTGVFGSGCAWFDENGLPHAVVPAASYDHCLVICLDPGSGQPLAVTRIQAEPTGITPVHHPDGWVGLSEGEGQHAARTWWVRTSGQRHIEVLDAGWDDWVLSDVDPSGSMIITTAHLGGPLLVRSFPSLEIVRSVDSPQDEGWDFTAFFADDMIVNTLLGKQIRFVAISPRGRIANLDQPEARCLFPAADGTWLALTQRTLQRHRMTSTEAGKEIPGQRNDEEIPGQGALW